MFLIFLNSILILLGLIATIIGLAVGLYKAVQFIEDKTYAAKKRIENIITAVSIFHIFLILRKFSLFLVGFSLCIQFLFYSLLDIYPAILPTNIYFVVGSLMAVINHFLFLRALVKGDHYILEMIFYFIVVVWLTPFCFFLSLSANDETLPVKGTKTKTRAGELIKRLFDFSEFRK
ncbi:putative Erv26-like transmembrane adaptor protein [Hamiltosporidium tvaerminnensis]|uniref:Putative Erv26-like transmembrane adaptor protein n=2 Tax=Hamiltosporidium TaxID=1176354 RepID=A0A4Q9KPK7_9MICR|nr:putative Erv26-like transmembrane adaptor protein [Hamiltosporidium magnivora]TBT96730.1 putative Erv26-like transmembrane adaptor protein [Hamiltosporidium tvaerminnensis]TBU00454.1 putative Erv26-like transmembrane adaptor protein [Hamiltosporidium magnivora]TBU11621.1 putative Erv26-like transmembrane adaptor protein [Hamiltosporidium tvaerminnensis]